MILAISTSQFLKRIWKSPTAAHCLRLAAEPDLEEMLWKQHDSQPRRGIMFLLPVPCGSRRHLAGKKCLQLMLNTSMRDMVFPWTAGRGESARVWRQLHVLMTAAQATAAATEQCSSKRQNTSKRGRSSRQLHSHIKAGAASSARQVWTTMRMCCWAELQLCSSVRGFTCLPST